MIQILRRQTTRLPMSSWRRFDCRQRHPSSGIFTSSSFRSFSDDGASNNNNNDDENGNSNSGGGKNGPNSAVPVIHVPTKFGDDAPRTPHVMALPVVNRPLFPGSPTTITLTDENTIHALDALKQSNDAASRPSYVGVFLRREDPSKVSKGGVILPPEIITSMSDLHQVGTFAEIKINRFPGFSSKNPNEGPDSDNRGEDSNGESDDMGDDSDPIASVTLFGHRRVDLVSIDDIGPPIGEFRPDLQYVHQNVSRICIPNV